MVPQLGVDDLAAGWAVGDVDADGSPRHPLLILDLDAAAGADAERIRAAADAVRWSVAVVAGVATRPPDPRIADLTGALALALAPRDVAAGRAQLVPVDDVPAATAQLAESVGAAPRASMVLQQVLRQTEHLDVRAGLAAEAAAYSVLLAGREFRDWLAERGDPRAAVDTPRAPVAVDRRGDTLLVRLDRPERRNAMNAAMRDALVDALTLAVVDPALRVEVSGNGANFSSGGDLDEFGSAREVDGAYLVRLTRHPGWLLHRLGPRALVRLHGACVGAGIEMPSLAHDVEADPATVFALPEVRMGVIPGAGGTVGIPRRIGRWRTAWLALTGARIDAATALDWGLVDRLTGG